ncbi:hypothetical protein [Halopseudomonas xiamenensis]|nr:hypothetical protein [Halopseudomonas xiamenensis]
MAKTSPWKAIRILNLCAWKWLDEEKRPWLDMVVKPVIEGRR